MLGLNILYFSFIIIGIWTKQFTLEGKEFWYNVTLGKSCWHPPIDSVTHEAEQLKNPAHLSPRSLETWKNEKTALRFSAVDDLLGSSTASKVERQIKSTLAPEFSISNPENNDLIISSTQLTSQLEEDAPAINESIDELINAAASQKQQKNSNRAKRFRAQDNETAQEEVSEYQKMVSDYQAISGAGSDDTFKWFVR